jgi:homoserine dehydrogenase
MKTVNVALVGFGTVGSGVAKILLEQQEALSARAGVAIRLVRIVDTDTRRDRGVKLPEGLLSDKLDDAVADPGVDIAVELVGGTGIARSIIERFIDAGKSVVTANKALLAEAGSAILRRAGDKGVSVGFEASVCGGLPIIMAIRDGLVANRIESIVGIVNGTANFILTSMKKQGLSYASALSQAQKLGYAEADPTLDVEGGDSAHKLAILAQLGFGADFEFRDIAVEGITRIDVSDIQYASELGYEVKLLAIGRQTDHGLELRVHPAMIPSNHPLAWVDGPMNAVLVRGSNTGPLLFQGQGAGQMPTASAVVSDIVDAALGKSKITFDYLKFLPGRTERTKLRPMGELRGRCYLRFTAHDEPGVLAQIAGCLGRHGISILSVVQKEARGISGVPIVMMTDEAQESSLRTAVEEIDRLATIVAPTVWIRVER